MRILAISFRPPLAFGRLGGASTPMDNYVWRDDPTTHGAARTIIESALTLDVLTDGSIFAFTPAVLRFRDNGHLRPHAPFFELWATVEYGADDTGEKPGTQAELALTSARLHAMGGNLSSLVYSVTVANRKAARRTGDDANAYLATAQVRGDDFTKRQLLASTPTLPGETPLVDPAHPIPLGYFQVIRPVPSQMSAVDLDILRVRFTPATGEVYGPPTAAVGRDERTRRSYEIVRPANRILNPNSSWLGYVRGDADPQPADTYDGADQGQNRSWGVVDDTCDGIITANLVVSGRNLSAMCRVTVGAPDYAPDRRPFVSLADDLADRDVEPTDGLQLLKENPTTQHRFADLFERVWETSSLTNLDSIRGGALQQNQQLAATEPAPKAGLPRTDGYSMLPRDAPYADANIEALIPGEPRPGDDLIFTQLIALAHESLADQDALIDFLLSRPERLRLMLRPAYGAFHQLAESVAADADPDPAFRDPRVIRDLMFDMRMPPYMRDETASPLALTRRQYVELMSYIQITSAQPPAPAEAVTALAQPPSDAAGIPAISTPLRRRVNQRLRMLGAQP